MKRIGYASDRTKGLSYPFDFPQIVHLPGPNHLNTRWLVIIISLPGVRETSGQVFHRVTAP